MRLLLPSNAKREGMGYLEHARGYFRPRTTTSASCCSRTERGGCRPMRGCDRPTTRVRTDHDPYPITSATSLRVRRRLGLAGALCALLTGSLAWPRHLSCRPVQGRLQTSRRLRAGAAVANLLFRQESLTGSQSTAWRSAVAGLRSPWWATCSRWDRRLHVAEALWPGRKRWTKLLAPGQEAITVLVRRSPRCGSRPNSHRLPAAHRSPVHQSQDSRMVPNTFEAYN